MKPIREFVERWYADHPIDRYGINTRQLTTKQCIYAGYHKVDFVCSPAFIARWCQENINEGEYYIRLVTAWFNNESDAVMMKLALSEYLYDMDYDKDDT